VNENLAGGEETSADGRLGEELCWQYSPLVSQAAFNGVDARIKGFSGPVGSGKSAALCFEAIRLGYLNGGRQGLIAAPTYTMLRDATLASLLAMMEDFEVDYEHRKSDGELELVGSNATILLRSLEEPERLRGTNLAWFGIDELSYAREEGWVRLEARLRDPRAEILRGFGVWTPQGHDWLYRRFIHQVVAGYACIRAKAFENRYLLERTPDYYERLESSYDPRFYQQEVMGEYLNSRTDRVYHCFKREVHVAKSNYDLNKTLFWALDFNVSPMTSVVAQQSGETLAVLDEIVLDRATTEEACQEFENRYGRHCNGLEIFGDASGNNNHSTGSSDYSIVQQYLSRARISKVRMRVPSKNPAVLSRVRRVNSCLTNALGEVRLQIDPKCKELIKDLEEVVFKPESGVIDKTRDLKRTHASDALGYLIWELYGEKPTFGEINKRLL
jgi:Terminase large subunit, T4likevirus-type, N-terminal